MKHLTVPLSLFVVLHYTLLAFLKLEGFELFTFLASIVVLVLLSLFIAMPVRVVPPPNYQLSNDDVRRAENLSKILK